MNATRHRSPLPARPRGSVAVTFAITLPLVLGMMGLPIDLSVLYLRNAELQQMADSVAAAAAAELNGTLAGVTKAATQATKMASNQTYGIYGTQAGGTAMSFVSGTSWSTSALFFSTAPSGADWLPADSVTAASAAGLLYAKVDTAQLDGLDAHPGRVSTSLMRLLGAPATVTAAPVAVAGKTGMQVTPLGICALNNNKLRGRALTPASAGWELEEFGYRRGVSYNLLDLNPNPSVAGAQSYLVNPIDDGKVLVPDPQHYTHDFIKPFFCSGTIAYSNLRANTTVNVMARGGVAIHEWLNSRFNQYQGDKCTPNAAPADANVKEYRPDSVPATITWMTTTAPAAKSYTSGLMRLNVATPDAVPSGVSTGDYGPLWIYKRPLKYDPLSGIVGGAFSRSDWSKLYFATSGGQFASAFNFALPYDPSITPPAGLAFIKRRMLYLPLLDCSGSIGSTATVLGVGGFLMSSKAASGWLYAEFEGLVDEAALASNVRRLQ